MANINFNLKIAMLVVIASTTFGCSEDSSVERTPISDKISIIQPTTPEVPTPDETPEEVVNEELTTNGTFESNDVIGWSTNDGASQIISTDEQAHSGNYSGKATGRTDAWNGPQYSMDGALTINETYDVSIWVKMSNAVSSVVKLTAKVTLDTGDQYIPIAQDTATDGDWVQLSGIFTNNLGNQSAVYFYVEGPDAEVEFYLDDLSVKLNMASQVDEFSEVTTTSLKALATFPIGVAVPAGNAGNSLLNSIERQDIVTAHFSQLSPENIMKMDALHPSEMTYNFVDADALISFAHNNSLSMHGHVLVWHSQTPSWMQDYTGDAAAWTMMMEDHVTQIASHFSGQLKSWDVVNEAFNEDGSYRHDDSIWHKNIGDVFIEKAFIAAKAADNKAELYYNDYNISWNEAKLDGIVAMAEDFIARNIPIDGIGFQMHVSSTGPDKAQLAKQLKKVVDLGLKVKITELDMRMNTSNSASVLTAGIAEIQKGRYFDIISTYLAIVPAAQRGGISVWGLIDSDSWIINLYGNPDWPLMFNSNYTAKPALQGFADALLAEPVDVEQPEEPEQPETPVSNEILANPDFESGISNWFSHGSTSVTLETVEVHSGNNSAKAADRTDGWNGIAHGVDGLLTAGETYTVSAWVKLANVSSDTVGLTVKLTDDDGEHYVGVNTITATDGEWMQLTGTYTHTVVGNEVSAYVYVEGPAAGVEYYIDDISVMLAE